MQPVPGRRGFLAVYALECSDQTNSRRKPIRGSLEDGERQLAAPRLKGWRSFGIMAPPPGITGTDPIWEIPDPGRKGSRRAILESSHHRTGHEEQPLPSRPCSHAVCTLFVQIGKLRHQVRNGHNSFIFPNSCEEVKSTSFRISALFWIHQPSDRLPEPVSSSAKWE